MKKRYKFAGGLLILLLAGVGVLAFTISRTAACPETIPSSSAPDAMSAVVYHCYGGPDVLTMAAVDKPVTGATEVLVKVIEASVNPLDWHYMRGSPYIMRLESGLGAPADHAMGVDFAGVVVDVGSSVTTFKTGDRVFGGANGAFGEYVVRDVTRAIAKIPDGVSFEQAAAVPIAGITALQALRDKGQLKPGQSVLINGASGGVGTYAVQIAKALGAEVTGVCSTRNLEMVLGIGADYVVDYKRENFTEGDKRYDLIIDNVGNHPIGRLTDLLNPGGSLVVVGAAKGDWIAPLMGAIRVLLYSPFTDFNLHTLLADLNAEDLQYLAGLMEQGAVKSVIDRRFSFDDYAAAIDYSESGRARGKIILNVSTDASSD